MNNHFVRWQAGSLPIYIKEEEAEVLLYAPGYLLRVERSRWNGVMGKGGHWRLLEEHARAAAMTQSCQSSTAFSPVSLHVYLTRQCNLRCQYCFSDPAHANPALMMPSLSAISSAAAQVAENCVRQQHPMTLACHGGGEPMMAENLPEVIRIVEEICELKNLPLFRYLATNGVMTAAQAAWVCGTFELVGLSCDGPGWIQNRQRPLWGGGESSSAVEQSAAIFRSNHQQFQVRTTLTGASWRQMPEIACYLAGVIQPLGVNVELAYLVGEAALREEDLDEFVALFFEARSICEREAISWQSSAVRPGQLHRQYCHILQDVLQVIPGDTASLCFLDNDQRESQERAARIGVYDPQKHEWWFDDQYIETARSSILSDVNVCQDCFLSAHCHRSCPDQCPLRGPLHLPDLHCRLNQRMMEEQLARCADQLRSFCHQHRTPTAGMEVALC